MKDIGSNGSSNARQPPLPPQPLLQCPRCNSFNTKFCYYNNNSVAQPRHFCKFCRRFWTEGGTLHNVPVRGDFFKGTKWLIRGGLAFGAPSSCSSSFIGECSRSQEQFPPPPPQHMSGFSNANSCYSFGESSTNFSLLQGYFDNPNLMRAPQSMVLQPNNIISRSGPSPINNSNQSPDEVDVDDYLLNYSPPPPSPPSSPS